MATSHIGDGTHVDSPYDIVVHDSLGEENTIIDVKSPYISSKDTSQKETIPDDVDVSSGLLNKKVDTFLHSSGHMSV